MNINKDGKTLYFSSEEIDNNTIEGEKKVFVTKRINGKESHKKINKNKEKNSLINDGFNNAFSFNDEIVIGVNSNKKEGLNKKNSNNKKSNSNKKENNRPKSNNKKVKLNNNYKKKSVKNNKKVVFIITIILIIACIFVFILTAPIFNITKIDVMGNSKLSAEAIISLSDIKIGENIFSFNNKIVSNIKENPYIENVQIKRHLPGSVKIIVEERDVKYQISLINGYIYIDKNGYILESSNEQKEVPTLIGIRTSEDNLLNEKRLIESDLEKLNDIMKIMEATKNIGINSLITEINFEEKDNYILYLQNERKRIYIGDSTNLTNKVLYIQRILENEKENSGTVFVNGDIGSGFKPYFREE